MSSTQSLTPSPASNTNIRKWSRQTNLPFCALQKPGPMGNVSPDKIITSEGAGERIFPAPEPKKSRSDSTSGQCFRRRYRKRTMTPILNPYLWGTYPLMRWFDVADVTTASKSTPSGYPAHPSNSTYPVPGRYGPPSPLNMSNLAYSLPNHHSPSSPFEHQHLIHPYPSGHPQGLVYPIQNMGHYSPNDGGSAPYAVQYAPVYGAFPMQHPGSVQHAGHYPQYVANLSMQNMGPGQGPPYVTGYYHPGYTSPSRHGSLSGSTPMRHMGSQSRQGSFSQGPQAVNMGPPKRKTDKRVVDEEYDVSKTIVDGSNPMKLAQPSSLPSGKWETMWSEEVNAFSY